VVLPRTVLFPRDSNTPEPFCVNPLRFRLTVWFDARTVPLLSAAMPWCEFDAATEFETVSRAVPEPAPA